MKSRVGRGAGYTIIALLMCAIIGLIIYTAHAGGSSLPVLGQASDFQATNVNGRKMSFSDTTGKVRLVTWFYTSCPDECPLTAYRMEQIQIELKSSGTFAKDVVFVSVTFDPKRDTLSVLNNWVARYHVNPTGWFVLRATPASTPGILSRWGVKTKTTNTEYIEHVLKTELIDQNGNIRQEYNTADLNVKAVISDIDNLLSRESWG